MRTPILHIGTAKTGATTLRHFLAENRDGRTARVKKRHGAAESCFRRALALEPDHARSRRRLERVPQLGAVRPERRRGLPERLRLSAQAPMP